MLLDPSLWLGAWNAYGAASDAVDVYTRPVGYADALVWAPDYQPGSAMDSLSATYDRAWDSVGGAASSVRDGLGGLASDLKDKVGAAADAAPYVAAAYGLAQLGVVAVLVWGAVSIYKAK